MFYIIVCNQQVNVQFIRNTLSQLNQRVKVELKLDGGIDSASIHQDKTFAKLYTISDSYTKTNLELWDPWSYVTVEWDGQSIGRTVL